MMFITETETVKENVFAISDILNGMQRDYLIPKNALVRK